MAKINLLVSESDLNSFCSDWIVDIIGNQEIIEKFFSNLKLNGQHSAKVSLYPYMYTKQQIFDSITRYLNE